MDSQIAKKNQSLTTAEEMRNQTKLVMQPYANWEEYLSPAPLSIAIMGELVFISSKTDFSINKHPPKDGYKYIKYPDSFRACLMQVCNSGWWAFNDAHKNMDQIRLHTLSVPDYMKTAVKILFQGNSEVVEAHLPDQLENIRTIADDCLKLATATEKRFSKVINIIQELLEACVNAEHFYGNKLVEIKKSLELNNIKKASAEEAAKRSAKAVKDMEEQLKEAQDMYSQAMKSIPSGWEMMAMDLAGAVTDSITGIMHGLTAIVSQPVTQLCKAATKLTRHYIRGDDDPADGVDKINIYSKSAEILAYAEIIQQCVHEDQIDWKNLYDQKNKATRTDFAAEQLKRIKCNLKQISNCKPNRQAQSICDQGIYVCNELAKYAPAGFCEDTITKKLIKNIRNFTESARKFDSKSKEAKSPSMTPKPPMMYKEEGKLEKKSALENASENARLRIEQSRAQLNKTREVYEKNVENMEKNQKELTDILIAMRNCEVKEREFQTTIKILIKGMDAMGRVKEQWEKMVHFFQMVSSIVKTSLTRTLKKFCFHIRENASTFLQCQTLLQRSSVQSSLSSHQHRQFCSHDLSYLH